VKQLLQNIKSGKTEIVEEPRPHLKNGHVLVQTSVSLISAGTERMLVEFGKAGYIAKAKSQPDKVRQVLEKIKTDGLIPTIKAVRAKLDQPLPLGYCNVGVVIEAESHELKAQSLNIGDRVVSNGPHAEIVSVPVNLCAKVPDKITDEEAAFTVVGAIGLQGIRLAQPTLGEAFVVTGLGLIGQLTVQLLIAHGCRVLGIDIDTGKCDLARQFGAQTVDLSRGEDPVEAAMAFSKGRGVDGVLITAATKSSEPVHQAAQMCRKRGRIVLVGVTGMELSRADFYEKELSFQVSCSYGPGRYDPGYEEKGQDYPFGLVRWTEKRNFEAVLDMMEAGRIDVKLLISHRVKFEEAEKAYQMISDNSEPYLGVILEYDPQITQITRIDAKTIQLKGSGQRSAVSGQRPVIGVIGAGNFTGQVLLPAIAGNNVRLKTIASSGGVTGTHLGKKFGFEVSTTDAETVFNDPDINTVFITTRHNSHAGFVIHALKAGKHVFVEKPLCLTFQELEEIKASYEQSAHNDQLLLVGFNRRFAPHVLKMKELLDTVSEPKSMVVTVNAGTIPKEHWTQDKEIGGGRIIGEACHFVDLLRFLAGCPINDGRIATLGAGAGDTASIELRFADGSIGTVHYFANGDKSFPKEKLEVFAGGKIFQLDNFKVLRGYGWKSFRTMKLWTQDKGHGAEVKAFLDAVHGGGPPPLPFDEIVEVTRVTLEIAGYAQLA
jgi:predicted dehydrogenase/threonine dehydrogenase-like Zn-dependent dehydrogenase